MSGTGGRGYVTREQWRDRAFAAERALVAELWRSSLVAKRRRMQEEEQSPRVSATGPREDIASGEVWPDESDPEYVGWLVARVADLERQLARAEELLSQYDRWGDKAMASLDEAVTRLISEEHGPPPHRLPSP